MIPVLFHEEAATELGAAFTHYESRLLGLGNVFSTQVQRAVQLPAAHPELGAREGARLRRLVVKRFPFSVVHRHDAQRIIILAVAHNRRRPRYWKDRQKYGP